MILTLSDVLGLCGAVLVLAAYFLVSTHRLTASSQQFHLINLIGSLGLFINAIIVHLVPFMLLNGVWAGVALYGLLKPRRR